MLTDFSLLTMKFRLFVHTFCWYSEYSGNLLSRICKPASFCEVSGVYLCVNILVWNLKIGNLCGKCRACWNITPIYLKLLCYQRIMKRKYFWLYMFKKGKPLYYWNMNNTQITFKLFWFAFAFVVQILIICFFAFRLQM